MFLKDWFSLQFGEKGRHIFREKNFPVLVLVFLMLNLVKLYIFFSVFVSFHATGLFLYTLSKNLKTRCFTDVFMFSISEPKRFAFVKLKRNFGYIKCE